MLQFDFYTFALADMFKIFIKKFFFSKKKESSDGYKSSVINILTFAHKYFYITNNLKLNSFCVFSFSSGLILRFSNNF